MPVKKSLSDIFPLDHHPALFLIHDGIVSVEFSLFTYVLTLIILFSIKCSIPEMKSLSFILLSAHHPALFLIHDGIVFSSIILRKSGFFVGFSNTFNEYFFFKFSKEIR